MILICRVPFSVRPQGVSIYDIGQSVREDTEVEFDCYVKRVKPGPDIYWRKGDAGALQFGTFLLPMSNSDGTSRLLSTYKVSFSRRDHGIKLHCLITRHNNRTDVWKTVDIDVSVICEYIMLTGYS